MRSPRTAHKLVCAREITSNKNTRALRGGQVRRERAEAIGAPWRADRSDWRARQPSLVALKGPIVAAGVQSWAALTDGVQVRQGAPEACSDRPGGGARAGALDTWALFDTRARPAGLAGQQHEPGAGLGQTGPAAGGARARSHSRFVLSFIHFIPGSLTYSVPLFLKRQCDRTPGGRRRWAGQPRGRALDESERARPAERRVWPRGRRVIQTPLIIFYMENQR